MAGGAIASRGESVQVSNCDFTYNTAESGGAIYILHGDLTINEQSVIAYNVATGAHTALTFGGGGIYIRENCSVVIGGGTLMFLNGASIGGGIYIEADGVLSVDSAEISQNEASYRGGGVYMDGTSTALFSVNTLISENSAPSGGDGISYDSELSSLSNLATMVDDLADPRF